MTHGTGLLMRTNNPRKKPHHGPRRPLRFHTSDRHTLHLFATLADGQPHNEDDVIAACAPLVPPHRAKRHTENQRVAQGISAALAHQLAIAVGQRRIVQQKLRSLERSGNAVRDNGMVTLTTAALADYRRWKNQPR